MKFYMSEGILLRRSNHVAERFVPDEKRWERTTAFNFMTGVTEIPREHAARLLPAGTDPAVLDAA